MSTAVTTLPDAPMRPGRARPDPPRLPVAGRLRRAAEVGQATAEYALVLLGVSMVAMLVLAWARDTNMVSRLLNAVFRSIAKLVS